jgi:asparagine synthase (glutamine-hydrolysing)
VYAAALAAAPQGLSALGRLQAADLRTMLAKDLLLKADRMSMAHSLELRVPLLDNEVVAAGLGLADRRKVRGVKTKVALRELVAQRLPEPIARRPKQGFEVPIDRWLRTELAPLARDLLSRERVAKRGLFDPNAVQRLLARHQSGGAQHGLALYSLLALELWHDQVVDAAVPRLAAWQ